MAEFLTTNATSHQIENIIMDSKEFLYLVSPYLQITTNFYERLFDANKKGVNIKIIYGKDQLKKDEKDKLYSLKNIEIHFSKNLHAKCYTNEKTMVITSMNMYEFSEKNNREMGILIDKYKDSKVFSSALSEIDSILNSACCEKMPSTERRNYSNNNYENKNQRREEYNGFCIRCNKKIELDTLHPYCSSCFKSWNQFANPWYEEIFCHCCGDPNPSTMEKPLCYPCYKQLTSF